MSKTVLDDPQAALRDLIRDGRAVIVAGTGVSMAASSHPQASWAGLLEHGFAWLKEHRHIDEQDAEAQLRLLKKNPQTHRFISAAQDIMDGMGGVGSKHFKQWLEATVGGIKAKDRAVLDALNAIREQGHLLATTNYDGLLLGEPPKLNAITWQERDELMGAVRDWNTDKVIFLHGYWRKPESVILDWTSYEQIARDSEYRDDLAAFWKTNTWVYVGCGVSGLSDPDFGLLLKRYGERARQAGHSDYCLVCGETQRHEFQAHFDTLKLNLLAVSYGESRSDLAGYLRSLLPPPTATPSTAQPPGFKPSRIHPPSTPSPTTSARTNSPVAPPNSKSSPTGLRLPTPRTSSSSKPSAATARACSPGSGRPIPATPSPRARRTSPGPDASGIRSTRAARAWRTSATTPSPT